MKNKLTNNMLKQMIREALNESLNAAAKAWADEQLIDEFDPEPTDTLDSYAGYWMDAYNEEDPPKNITKKQAKNYLKTVPAIIKHFKLSGSSKTKAKPPIKTKTKAGPIKPPIKTKTKKTKPPANKIDFGITKVNHGLTKKKVKGAQFDYNIASLPIEIKKIILRTFGKVMSSQDPSVTDADKLKALADIAESVIKENKSNIDWEDFATIISNPDSPYYKAAVLAIKQTSNVAAVDPSLTKAAATLSKVADELAPEATDLDSKTRGTAAVLPQIPNIDIADAYGGERKNVPPYVIKFFNSLDLGGARTVVERIKAINDMTLKIVSTDPAKAGQPTRPPGYEGFMNNEANLGELMSAIAVQGLAARIVKKMDDKAAGWAFESFLAQLVNGIAVGGDGTAVDFKYGIDTGGTNSLSAGNYGSAKLVSGGLYTQSKSTVDSDLSTHGSFYYIIAYKKPDHVNVTNFGKGGTATPEDIAAIDLSLVEVNDTSGAVKYGPPGSANNIPTISGTDYHFSTSASMKSNIIGTILLNTSLGNLNQLASNALSTLSNDIPELIKEMETLRRSSNEYLTSGEATDMEKAADSYVSLFTKINNIFGSGAAAEQSGVAGGVEVSGGKLQRKATTVAENKKKSKKDLDNFIKQVILESLLKK